MGDRVLLDPGLAPALAAAGLTSAQALLTLGGAETAHNVTAVLDLPVEGTAGRFHLKRYHYPGWQTSRGLLGRGTLWGRAPEVNEFKALAWLREHGIPAVRPIAAASRTRRGRLVAHALLTEDVPDALDLGRRLADPEDPVRADPHTRRRVLGLVALHLQRMHAEGFVHRDCHPRNVLVRVEEGDPRIWFCDCRRGGPPSWRHGTLDDLADMEADLEGLVPRSDRYRALGDWVDEGDPRAPVARKVHRRAARRRR